MAIVTLFISAVLGLLWLLETKAAGVLPPAFLTGAEAAGATALYLLFVRITGRRKSKTAAADAEGFNNGAILVAYASQTGFAEELAQRTVHKFEQSGLDAQLVEFSALDTALLKNVQTALFIASTTGEGDPPDTALKFFAREMSSPADLSHLRYALLALGDSNYGDYCAFGRHLDAWLQKSGATALFERIDVDRGNHDAVTNWFHQLTDIGAAAGDAFAADFEKWRIDERRLLNPGSDNPPVYHVRLKSAGALPQWRAGDIAVVHPRNAPEKVEDFLRATGHNENASVVLSGETMRLQDALAQLVLSGELDLALMQNASPQAVVDVLEPISPRDYSLASVPADGKVELVIRQMRYPDGCLGIGCGWLTEYAGHDSDIAMRVRSNPSFHGPDDDRPMILIGAGSGIAGLRAHLKERIGVGRRENWMIFGERSPKTDFLFRDEIETWHSSNALYRLDLCFFKDGKQTLVQDVLRTEEQELREWLKNGAAIYICGSRAHLGVGVETALKEIIGVESFTALRQSGRYRADVY